MKMSRTQLVQLPQHILHQIISRTVNVSYSREAWTLRLVCKTFNQEFLHAVFDSNDTTLFDAIINREFPFYSNVGRFRCMRGFLLRHGHRAEQLTLWQQLDGAVSILSQHIPKAVSSASNNRFPSPDRFMKIVSTDANAASRENAIAMVCDAFFSFVVDDISVLDLFHLSWYHSDLFWENLEDKTPEFWLLAVAARRNDMDLCRTVLERLRCRKNELDAGVWIDNLSDALRLPALHGLIDMVNIILQQQGLLTEHIMRRGSGRQFNSIELAAGGCQPEMVQLLISRGVGLHDQRDYSRSFSLAIRSSKEISKRRTFIELFTSLTPEWRSNDITAGIIEDVCMHGDLETVKMVVEKFETSAGSRNAYSWQWTTFDHPASILVEASRSNSTELVQYLIDNRTRLSSLLEESFSTDKVLEALETSIGEKHPEVLAVLFKQELPESIMKERLLAYAAITSDTKTLELVSKDINLNQKFDDDSDFWDYYLDNSRLGTKMFQVGIDETPYMQERSLLTLGTISLLLAIKAGNVEIAKWFLEQGIRLGRRYMEYSRWLYISTASLIMTDDTFLNGKGRIFGFTLRARGPLAIKRMLEGGTCVFSSTLIFTHGRSDRQIKTAIDKGKKETKVTRFLDKLRIGVHRAVNDSYDDARVVFGIEVSNWSYMDLSKREHDETRFSEMSDLLYKHRHPSIYINSA